MSDLPRVLAIMGSGETAPTMARVHRRLASMLPSPAHGVVLDTPYGFQENADEITTRTLGYFRHNIGLAMELATFRRATDDPLVRAGTLERVRDAGYLFAGPGSPTYALDAWRSSELPGLVGDKLQHGGVVVFASAAALTLGSHTVPVYEIYKVGSEPTWRPGLDVLGTLGLHVAVIPHYDNSEGGTHDTRFCYLGEHRLRQLEAMLPADTWILGVDSHTALVLDLGQGVAQVEGVGGLVVRVAGRTHRWPSGTTITIEELRSMAVQLGSEPADASAGVTSADTASGADLGAPPTPFADEMAALGDRFDTALSTGDVRDATRAVLELDDRLRAWTADTDGGPDPERGRQLLRSCIVRLGETAGGNATPPTDDRLAALVELLIDLRDRARVAREFRQADWIRTTLTDLQIEIRDGDDTTSWLDRRQPG